MKKLVLKTVCITLAGILALGVILFGIFALISPKTIANVADKMGNYSVSVFYYEKAYEKSESLDDLYTLIVKLDEESDGAKTEKYCEIMFKPANSGEVAVFMMKLDSKNVGAKVTTCEFIYGKYAIALCSQNSIEKCKEMVNVSVNYAKVYGYTENAPLTVALLTCGKNMNKETLQAIQSEISKNDIAGNFNDLTAESRNNLTKDKVYLNKLINELN
ncbi:MAG: hypothetical protein IJY57_01120 [Clostridia bacterium]|nr:hypothetical protein [Clostridia bacterium]